MFAAFPVKRLDRLPNRIDPCPILEAAFELRFTTRETWLVLPGLVKGLLEGRYPEQVLLPLDEMPEQVRKMIPGSVFLPHCQFRSETYCINLGPQMIGLCIQPGKYPGWAALESELKWLLGKILAAGFMDEGERLGVRYGDFFATDIFRHIDLSVAVNGQTMGDDERQFTTVFKEGPMSIRLMLANSVVAPAPEGPRQGSLLDVDVSFGALDFDLDNTIMERFIQAHAATKQLFFGLVTDAFLKTLNPQYA